MSRYLPIACAVAAVGAGGLAFVFGPWCLAVVGPLQLTGFGISRCLGKMYKRDARMHHHSSFTRMFIGLYAILSPLAYAPFLSAVLPLLLPFDAKWSWLARSSSPASEVAVAFGSSVPARLAGFVLVGGVLYAWASVFFEALSLAAPRLHTAPHRVFVSWMSTLSFSSVLFSIPFLPLAPFFALLPVGGWQRWMPTWVMAFPFLLGFIGVLQSLYRSPWRQFTLEHGPNVTRTVQACRVPTGKQIRIVPPPQGDGRKLRVIQLTDMHLGPFLTVKAMQRICEEVLVLEPDIVLLTGDFHTPQSEFTPGCLAESLAPLKRLPAGTAFAVAGNHDKDHDWLWEAVQADLDACGIRTLINEEAIVTTSLGQVQVLGADYPCSIARLLNQFPPIPAVPRLVLMHTPHSFRGIPLDDPCLAFAGHTHGGQIGLVSFGIPLTVVGKLARDFDFGLWGRGLARMYVHRGTGFRSLSCSYIVRLGVSNEQSVFLLEPHRASSDSK